MKQKSNSTMATTRHIIIMALAFLFLNIRSLPQHKVLFEQLLLEEHIHAFILNETHLKSNILCNIPRFNLLRHDSNIPAQRANGDTAIGIPLNIAHRQYTPPLQNIPEYLMTTIYFQQIYITLAKIYIRPGHPIPHNFFAYISNTFTNYIIMTDVNIHSRADR